MIQSVLGDRYNNAHPNSKPFNMTAYKGKQMMVSGNNKHSACQSGYFEPKFSRILEAEVGFCIDHLVILLDLSLSDN